MRPHNKHRAPAIAAAVASAVLGGTPLLSAAQSSLPQKSPTAQAIPSADAVSAATPAPIVHPAEVSYQMGQLTVIAENSSLDAILRDIAQKTGMKITGSVTSQQVYGTYGPAAPGAVLASLLEGSGNNMILREDSSGHLIELVLAPTQGAPASPIAGAQAQTSVIAPQPFRAPASYSPPQYTPPQNLPPPRQDYVPPPPEPVYAQPAIVTRPTDGTQPPDATQPADQASQPDANVPRSPNGVATPQQIFQELQQLQQRQKAQPPAPAQ